MRSSPLSGLPALLLATGCSSLPLLTTEEYENALGVEAYAEATAGYEVITGTTDSAMVQRIGERIARASGKEDYAWEFKLLRAPDTVNAFALPGGKVAVYTGLLSVTQNEDALAAVMGHEVAHATLRHGGQRISAQIYADLFLAGAAIGLGYSEMDDEDKGLVLAALGIGTQVGGLLPYSRAHESEADEVGLRYLIRAGYDPYQAPLLWDRMAALNPNRPPEFLSTHPDPLARADRLRELIPVILAEEDR